MLYHWLMVLLSRRGWLAITAGAIASGAKLHGFGKAFWDVKEPAEWSSEEIGKLVTKSPWAKEVAGDRVRVKKKAPAGPGLKPSGRRKRNAVPANSDATRVQTVFSGIVCWESARPVREAFREALPDEFAGMYVISVSGVPAGAKDAALERMRHVTTLYLKNRTPLEAAVAKHWEANRSVLLFGFAKAELPVSKDDKEILFHSVVNRAEVNVRFAPRQMLYRGELAL